MNELILIPVKEVSLRCPRKNVILLPYIAKYLGQYKDNAVVISDAKFICNYAEQLGLKSFYSEISNNECEACRDFIISTKYSEKAFILLPTTHPVRELDLVNKILNTSIEEYDFITSYNVIQDRSIFKISLQTNDFTVESKERKGELCGYNFITDGAIYRIKTEFLLNSSSNEDFWKGKKFFVRNNVPFLDIDTKEDLSKFFNMIDVNECWK